MQRRHTRELGDFIDDQSEGNSGAAIKRHGIRADTLKIFKFDGSDYHLWEFSMICYLKVVKLWSYVNGDIGRPDLRSEEGLTTQDLEIWEDANTEAESIIMASISKGQMQLITMCNTAHEMWVKLKDTYQHESQTNKLRPLEKYHSYVMKRGSSLENHIKVMDSMVDRLRGVGELVSDHIKVINLLKSLPREYNMIKTTLLDRDSLTYSQCCSRLLDHSAMIQNEGGSSGTAYYGNRRFLTKG